jgi:hypothetical protein
MSDNATSRIRSREYAKQLRDFKGLQFGKIMPTDIDGFLDFGGKAFVFIETKHGSAPVPFGQKLALERLCDTCQAAGVETVVLVGRADTEGDIDTASLPVTLLRLRGVWRTPRHAITVRKGIEEFRFWVGQRKV